jgi:hypothetical protein
MQRHAHATTDDERLPASALQRREGLVTVLAVASVAVAAVLAAATHTPRDALGDAPRVARGGTVVVQAPPLASRRGHVAPACAECDGVAAVVPLRPTVAAPGTARPIPIRMDDASVHAVDEPGSWKQRSRAAVRAADRAAGADSPF